jgi:hypothetical protein
MKPIKPLHAFSRIKAFAAKGKIKTKAEIENFWDDLNCSAEMMTCIIDGRITITVKWTGSKGQTITRAFMENVCHEDKTILEIITDECGKSELEILAARSRKNQIGSKQAWIVDMDKGYHALVSYNTVIALYNYRTNDYFLIRDAYCFSSTTGRHISAFHDKHIGYGTKINKHYYKYS